ncbi:hypothetical protein BDQ12DRAFT_700218 [Crucibulum laeve]|uniref:AhpD-like protein n=1 Tax=Crucibulum laeve TaxID=68775 RepID=A0A5C3LNY0_9AGAR|nr:hypothetical protein BDQ12DRAFT_700218 [Crucibulum laeve]
MKTPIANTAFLKRIKSLYPVRKPHISLAGHDAATGILSSPWYIVAAAAFSASNKPSEVARVFRYALQEAEDGNAKLPDRQLLAQKMRESLFKSGLISGYPKWNCATYISIGRCCHHSMATAESFTSSFRNPNAPLADYAKTGQALFNTIYGETAGDVQNMLNAIYPDMGWFSTTIGYGLTYGYTDILSPLETSYTLVAALIAGDTPQQIKWHLKGACRAGASLEQVKAVREIAMDVAQESGVEWREEVPPVEES